MIRLSKLSLSPLFLSRSYKFYEQGQISKHLIQNTQSGPKIVSRQANNSHKQNLETREYFYFIDHNGQLFLDDSKMKNFTSCFKEKEFLTFFNSRISYDKQEIYHPQGFYFKSLCQGEINYIKCDDLPVVFTHLLDQNFEVITPQFLESIAESPENPLEQVKYLAWGGFQPKFGSDWRLVMPFDPNSLFISEFGRIYHAAKPRFGGLGLIKSSISIDFYDFWSEYLREPNPTDLSLLTKFSRHAGEDNS